MFTNLEGVPPGGWKLLYVDSVGRLWVGARRGLGRTDNPTADTPQFVTYTTAQGLASDEIHGISEDRWGRIYVATGRGVDRLTPQVNNLAAGAIQHFTYSDGLATGELTSAYRDHSGDLWFATNLGVSQFTPTTDRHGGPAPVLVTGVQIGAASYPVADVGQAEDYPSRHYRRRAPHPRGPGSADQRHGGIPLYGDVPLDGRRPGPAMVRSA